MRNNCVFSFLLGSVKHAFMLVLLMLLPCSALTEKVLYSFSGGTDGAGSDAPLIIDNTGNLYGTTTAGGTNGLGTVFELSRSTSGWAEKVLYDFTGGSDGSNPYAGLVIDQAGNLYGTAWGGGSGNGCGTVIELSPSSGGVWIEKTVYTFLGNGSDGCNPFGGLTLDPSGNLFGTTQNGGLQGKNGGTVFELTPFDSGWSYQVLWSFDYVNGATPRSGVVFDNAGNMFTTAQTGGEFYGNGTVVKITQSGSGWTGKAIYVFSGGDNGCGPMDGVVFDSAGNLYGTTQKCGADNAGVVFKLSPTIGQWQISVLHTFTGGTDGAFPFAGVSIDSHGSLWGTTQGGGLYGNGTVYRLSRTANGHWRENEYGFHGGSDGAQPSAGVLFAPVATQTVVLGTTTEGGPANAGVIYSLAVK